jgi:hypothetical protein
MARKSQLVKDLKRIETLLLNHADTANLLINVTHADDGWDSIVISAVNPDCPVNKALSTSAGIEEHYQ